MDVVARPSRAPHGVGIIAALMILALMLSGCTNVREPGTDGTPTTSASSNQNELPRPPRLSWLQIEFNSSDAFSYAASNPYNSIPCPVNATLWWDIEISQGANTSGLRLVPEVHSVPGHPLANLTFSDPIELSGFGVGLHQVPLNMSISTDTQDSARFDLALNARDGSKLVHVASSIGLSCA
jgi:hypothetical protein